MKQSVDDAEIEVRKAAKAMDRAYYKFVAARDNLDAAIAAKKALQ